MNALQHTIAERQRIELTGVVQGVGFRPFVLRLADALGLAGWVANRANGVVIELEGTAGRLAEFARRLSTDKPAPARIEQMTVVRLEATGEQGFVIAESLAGTGGVPALQPDSVPCPNCLAELQDPANRRYRYPFISCAECGPRFSIAEALPFDRARTTLVDFPLCPQCLAEYRDPADRRFHAQTMGCADCGPQLGLLDADGAPAGDATDALDKAVAVLRGGGIVALKGIGGFQLLVDACNEAAVQRLRQRKQRPRKPLAIMVADLAALAAICRPAAAENDLVSSAAGPIVLVGRRAGSVAQSVAPESPSLGVMLPSSGLHHLLLALFGGPLVVTSGNRSEAPIAIDTDEALAALAGIADVFLVHDRRVAARLDDSVAQIACGRPQTLRRARGYVPLTLPLETGPGLLALGAQQKNTVAIGLGQRVVLSQHHGDLDDPETRARFEHSVSDLLRLHRHAPAQILVDAHPDYASSNFGEELGARHEIPVSPVAHHVAHLHAVIAEHGLALPVFGIAWDGLGLGAHRALWGGEFFRVSRSGAERVAGFVPFPLPGGQLAAVEPRRAALGLLHRCEGDAALHRAPLLAAFSHGEASVLAQMLARGVNCPLTSSVGRIFDAIASLLGLRQRSGFEGDAAMQLQFAAESREGDCGLLRPYPFGHLGEDVDWRPMLLSLLDDVDAGRAAGEIALRFHLTLAAVSCELARRFAIPSVVLGGGCFQNRLLLKLCVASLSNAGFEVHWPQQVPANDGGLALGQLGAARFGHFAGSEFTTP